MTASRGPVTIRPARPSLPVRVAVDSWAALSESIRTAIDRRHGEPRSTSYRDRGGAEDTQ